MKLSASQIPGFLAAPPPSVRAFLFYGPDPGLAHERAEALVKKLAADPNDPFAVVSLSGAALGSDAARLCDEAASMVLTGGRRVIRVHQAVESNAGPLGRFLGDPPPGDSVVVIEAGDLEKRSKLRSLCEGASPLAAGIPCYLEDAAARSRSIGSLLQAENLRAAPDVLRFLADILPPDRMALRSELDKLILYAQGKKEIEMDDVRAIIADAGGAETDEWVHAVAEGRLDAALSLWDRLAEEQASPVALLRALQRHFLRLHLARGFMDEGLSAEAAVKKLSPAVFWKNVDPMIRQLRRWSSVRLAVRLEQLLQTETALKKTGAPAEALCAQLALTIAVKG